MPEGTKVIGVIFKGRASRHSDRPQTYGVNMVREENSATLEDRKNLACHPLDRNRSERQVAEGLDKRKGGIR